MASVHARLKNQYKFKKQTVFSARFDKQDEDNLVLDETEIFVYLNINFTRTETDIVNIHIKSPLAHQFRIHEMKESGWRFIEINSMTIYFYKTGEMNGSSFMKIPLRSSVFLNTKKDDKCCFIWSIPAHRHPFNNSHPRRLSNYRQKLNELKIELFDFSNGFKCSDVQKLEKLKKLSFNIVELTFYQDQNKWKYQLIPIEKSKNEDDRVVDFLIYKNNYVLVKQICLILGNRKCNFSCRKTLNFLYKSQCII